MQPFHLAIPVHDLAAADGFYGGLIGCATGRRTRDWTDFNFFGHQLTVHLQSHFAEEAGTSSVDSKRVPVRHFGIVLAWDAWQALADKLKAARLRFVIEPYIRFAGETGEQATMFLLDPSGNALEFKSFKDASQLFAPYE